MPRFRLSLRRTAAAGFVVAAAGCAAHAAALAYWRTLPPGAAPALARGDPTIVTNRTNFAIANGMGAAANRSELATAARAALRRDPLEPIAVSTLGRLETDAVRGLALVKAAERLSRRDGPTELMLIEVAAQDDDLAQVLVHYNRLLMADPGATPLLQPVLARGLTEPAIREGLAGYAGRPWFKPFLLTAVANGAEPSSLVALIGLAKGRMVRSDLIEVARQLADQFANSGRFTELGALPAALPYDVGRSVRNFGFGTGSGALEGSPLGWMLGSTASGEAAVATGGEVEVRVAPEETLFAARRFTFLAPGRFVLNQTIRNDTGAPPARLEWKVGCRSPEAPHPTITPFGRSQAAPGEARLLITIPATCLVQEWILQASGTLSQEPARASLTGLSLAPA